MTLQKAFDTVDHTILLKKSGPISFLFRWIHFHLNFFRQNWKSFVKKNYGTNVKKWDYWMHRHFLFLFLKIFKPNGTPFKEFFLHQISWIWKIIWCPVWIFQPPLILSDSISPLKKKLEIKFKNQPKTLMVLNCCSTAPSHLAICCIFLTI